ncbi:hypothetical protein APHAL10511_006627 [Amanita phalloides]|nr:hypothetical protein APHAL10511_006627 [Amanita phalloides]
MYTSRRIYSICYRESNGLDVQNFHIGPLRLDLQARLAVISLEPQQDTLRTPLPNPSTHQEPQQDMLRMPLPNPPTHQGAGHTTQLPQPSPGDNQINAVCSTSQQYDPLLQESQDGQAACLSIPLPSEPEVANKEMITFSDMTLPVTWMFKYGLIDKRIWAIVCNSKLDFMEGVGFRKGQLEGKQVLILSGEENGAIRIHHQQQTHMIYPQHLFPAIPTSKGQMVVVFHGDRAGEEFKTCQQNEDGMFPVAHQGSSGAPVCSIEASWLVKCNLKK